MSWIVCRCGEMIKDITDAMGYKGRIISDKEFFPLLDLADEHICSVHSDKNQLAMSFRTNIGKYIRFREIFQCRQCGRIIIENEHGDFCFFAPEEHNCNDLLDFDVGEKIPVK